MALLWFDIIATLIYAASMVCLLHEFRASTPEARHERQRRLIVRICTIYDVKSEQKRIRELAHKYVLETQTAAKNGGQIRKIFSPSVVFWGNNGKMTDAYLLLKS